MLATVERKIFLCVFCIASVLQGMYSTYFVSILTTLERLYQIQSRTAGIILSASELGQVLGSLLIAYYGGKGNKPKWIAVCLALSAIAAITTTFPHFLYDDLHRVNGRLVEATLKQPQELLILVTNSSRKLNLPTKEHLCLRDITDVAENFTPHHNNSNSREPSLQIGDVSSRFTILSIFYVCVLTIGFGSTAITTLGIPFIDDIMSKKESPLYMGLTIGLHITGPALGFLLGSICVGLKSDDISFLSSDQSMIESQSGALLDPHDTTGLWWLGLILISLPLLLLTIPMYCLSRSFSNDTSSTASCENLDEVTYKAAEDHDIGGSRDFQSHILKLGDPLDVTSNRTFYSDIDASSSREALQASSPVQYNEGCNFIKGLTINQPSVTRDTALIAKSPMADSCEPRWVSNCLIVNHFGDLESTKLAGSEVEMSEALIFDQTARNSFSSVSTCAKIKIAPPSSSASMTITSSRQSTLDLSSSLLHLIQNKLLVMRMISRILHILPVAGFYAFLPKYFIEYFQLDVSSASLIVGLAGILFVGLGAFLGGIIMRVMNVNSRLMTKWIAASALLYTLGMIIMMSLSCPQNEMTVHHANQYSAGANRIGLDASDMNECSSTCKCSSSVFSPVCANGITYLSPCLAGCRGYTIKDDNKIVFDGCDCSSSTDIWLGAGHNISTSRSLANRQDERPSQGHCLVECDKLKWYIMVLSLFTLIHASSEVGSTMLNLRCVKQNERALAMGLLTFSASLLGTIPCSVVYGSLIDTTCVHWDSLGSSGDGSRGACRAYKSDRFRYSLHGVTALIMFLAFLVDCLISKFARGVDFYETDSSDQDNRSNCASKTTVRVEKSNGSI